MKRNSLLLLVCLLVLGCRCDCSRSGNAGVEPYAFGNLAVYFRSLPEAKSVFLQELPPQERINIAAAIPGKETRYSINMLLDVGHVSVEMILFPRNGGGYVFCMVEQVEQANSISFWEFNKSSSLVELKDILPDLIANDFLKEGVDLLPYRGTMLYSLGPEGNIGVELHRWMEPELENADIRYEIRLVWAGEKFDVTRIPIKD
ncbi:MAG: hypothetical protein GY765_21920 [bacterium]|nr:hypothetical protein [bacterium]